MFPDIIGTNNSDGFQMPRTIKLSDLEINGIKIKRRLLPEQFKAFCSVNDCGWFGPWRSIWHDWNTLLADIEADLKIHTNETHT
jgi:hypothetical protein